MDAPQESVSSVASPPILTKTKDKTNRTTKARVDATKELLALQEKANF